MTFFDPRPDSYGLPAATPNAAPPTDTKYESTFPQSPMGGKEHTWQWVFDIGIYTGSQQNRSCTPGLTTSNLMTVNTDQMPDYWLVSIICASAPGGQIGVYLGPGQSGPPIRLGSGGMCKIVAQGQNYLTIVNLGSQTVFGTVIAVAGDTSSEVAITPATIA